MLKNGAGFDKQDKVMNRTRMGTEESLSELCWRGAAGYGRAYGYGRAAANKHKDTGHTREARRCGLGALRTFDNADRIYRLIE